MKANPHAAKNDKIASSKSCWTNGPSKNQKMKGATQAKPPPMTTISTPNKFGNLGLVVRICAIGHEPREHQLRAPVQINEAAMR